jgi:hypothetical protein
MSGREGGLGLMEAAESCTGAKNFKERAAELFNDHYSLHGIFYYYFLCPLLFSSLKIPCYFFVIFFCPLSFSFILLID